MKPLCIDLCCGTGGWAAGFLAAEWRVIGFDIEPQMYPGEFRLADVRDLDGREFWMADMIVASPPCEQFSRHQMPWTRRRNPPPPDLSVVDACLEFAAAASCQRGQPIPFLMENVRAAQRWIGTATWRCGSYYLWGSVPALMPRVRHRKKESMTSAARLERARIPFELAHHIAQVFYPSGFRPVSAGETGGLEGTGEKMPPPSAAEGSPYESIT